MRKPIDVIVRRNDCLEVIYISRGRGRPKKIWIETLRNDLRVLIIDKIAYQI